MEEGTYTLGWGQQTFLEGKGTSKPWFLNLSFIGILGLDGSLSNYRNKRAFPQIPKTQTPLGYAEPTATSS